MLRLLLRLVSAVVVLGLLVVGGTAAGIWWTARGDDRTTTDAIVVLGASQFDGRPSSVLEARLEHARALYEQGVAPVVVTVGGSREGDRFTEAQAGAEYLQARGVEDVVAVGEGRNTLASLEAVARVFEERGWDTATVVTDPWHSLRSRTMARDVGLEARTSPTRAGPSVRTRETQVRYILRETGAYLYYRVLGDSAGSGPPAV
ncbi:MAG TPA: YdcF family protein [Mycobacteriales bacterium]|nr:YdcF family protein [Mycobacteriales bacterium]